MRAACCSARSLVVSPVAMCSGPVAKQCDVLGLVLSEAQEQQLGRATQRVRPASVCWRPNPQVMEQKGACWGTSSALQATEESSDFSISLGSAEAARVLLLKGRADGSGPLLLLGDVPATAGSSGRDVVWELHSVRHLGCSKTLPL